MSASGTWLGHFYLRPPGAAAADRAEPITIELDGPVPESGRLLALRLLSPLAAMTAPQRMSYRVLLAGQNQEIATRACAALGLAQTETWTESMPQDLARFHRILFGCGGTAPTAEQLKPLIAHLRHDGELGLFDLPADELSKLHQALGKQGLALRSAGTEGSLGFLSGSIEEPQRFAR